MRKVSGTILEDMLGVVVCIVVILCFNVYMHYTEFNEGISCVTCPCGTQYLAPYKTCNNCGESSMQGTYYLKYTCINCGEISAGHVKCPKCGLEISTDKRNGKVKDLPAYVRKDYQ